MDAPRHKPPILSQTLQKLERELATLRADTFDICAFENILSELAPFDEHGYKDAIATFYINLFGQMNGNTQQQKLTSAITFSLKKVLEQNSVDSIAKTMNDERRKKKLLMEKEPKGTLIFMPLQNSNPSPENRMNPSQTKHVRSRIRKLGENNCFDEKTFEDILVKLNNYEGNECNQAIVNAFQTIYNNQPLQEKNKFTNLFIEILAQKVPKRSADIFSVMKNRCPETRAAIDQLVKNQQQPAPAKKTLPTEQVISVEDHHFFRPTLGIDQGQVSQLQLTQSNLGNIGK